MRRRCKGQALSETLVAFVVLVPIFMLVPYLGKYLDVKHKAEDGARYALWERTVFSDPGASWDANENQKSDGRIRNEIRARFLEEPRAAITAQTPTTERNPLWEDHTGGELVALADFESTIDESREPFPYGLRGRSFLGKPDSLSLFGSLAQDGLPLLNQLDGLSNILGGALDFTLGLNDRGFVESRVTVPAIDLPVITRLGATLDINVAEEQRAFTARGAILTDSWTPGTEGNYRERLDGLVIDEIVSFLVAPGTFTFGFFPVFIEGLDGQNPTLESESNVLPERYVDD